MPVDLYSQGLDSPYRDPQAGRRGRILARILLTISILLTVYAAYDLATGSPEDPGSLRFLLLLLGWDAFLSLTFVWPAPGTGGFPAHPRSRRWATAIGIFIAVAAVAALLACPSSSFRDVPYMEGGLLVSGVTLVFYAWRPAPRPRGSGYRP